MNFPQSHFISFPGALTLKISYQKGHHHLHCLIIDHCLLGPFPQVALQELVLSLTMPSPSTWRWAYCDQCPATAFVSEACSIACERSVGTFACMVSRRHHQASHRSLPTAHPPPLKLSHSDCLDHTHQT